MIASRKESDLNLRSSLICAALPLLALLPGCASRTGVAYLQIENDQSGNGGRAEPVYVDPRVEVIQNQYARSYLNEGSNIRQTIRIRGPIMIVPAPGPATQPAR
ncbi:MAG: hypothetical protein JWN40_4567 [Phycisphaerales bacterium]|nr:hypothetical protein [Phycisphaerales bacterium]